MDLTPAPEQELLVRSARTFLARACPPAHVRAMEADAQGFSAALWREIAGLGWPAMALPAEYGGGGLGFLDVTLLLEEMGRVLLPSPFVATAVLGAPLVLAAGSEEQRRRWLPRLAAGDAIATLALVEPGWRDEWGAATARVHARRVSGTKRFVPFAAAADLLLVAAANGGLVAVEHGAPGVECARQATLDGGHVYEVRFADTPAEALPGPAAAALARARLHAAVAALAFSAGAAERVLEMTVEHAKTRVQFGRPIGGFQAVAHRCADMRSDLDALRWLVYQAAWALDTGRPGELEVGAAKAYGSDALRRLLMHAHQVHGAIGFSTEHDLQLFTRRAKAAELAWGSATLHRERVARAMGL